MIFNKQKKSKVKYIINADAFSKTQTTDTLSLGIFKNIETHSVDVGCPAISSGANRVFTVNAPITFKLELYFKQNVFSNQYNFDTNHYPDTELMHNFIDSSLTMNVERGLIIQAQHISPYSFITDDKDLEVMTVPPVMNSTNMKYIGGAFKPYGWIRNINSSWHIIDNKKTGVLYFDETKPYLTFVFNKPIDLEYTEMTPAMYNYYQQNKRIVHYTEKMSNLYPTILSRRPNKLL
jgi:hypothetical protein